MMKGLKTLKEISKKEIEALIDNKVIYQDSEGYSSTRNHFHIGYYKTCGGKRYIEDNYANIAKKLTK